MTAPVYKTSLKARIILALGLIVTVTSGLFAYGVLQMKEQLEEIIFDNMVYEQLQVLLAQVQDGSYEERSLFKDWRFHVGDTSDVDPVLLALQPGSHHSVRIGERYYQVEVGNLAGSPVYLTYDITEWEQQEHELLELLAWGIAILFVIAMLMGVQASRNILAPVRAFTARLATIHPRERNVRISPEFQGNEIAQIAHAFDQYLERLDQFVERERSFTAAASHELRTPLSVMMGAIDVLETQHQSATAQRALARLRRACEEMRAFIEATLFLSREDSNTIPQDGTADIGEIVRALLEDNQSLLQERHIAVSTHLEAGFTLQRPASIVKIMIGNILRNAIEHTRDGSIIIRGGNHSFSVEDTGTGIAAQDLPRIFERNYTTKTHGIGLGLYLVTRICDCFDWQVDIASTPGNGTTATLHFFKRPL